MRFSQRPGQINGMWLAFLASALVLVLLIVPLVWDPGSWFAGKRPAVFVYCAAGLKQPVEEAARAYEKETGNRITLQFGGSQTLLAQAELGEQGDLYIPADNGYVNIAHDRRLIDEVLPLARMTAVLVVAKGNPLKVQSLDDVIQRSDVRMAQADHKQAAVGKLTREVLNKSGKWAALAKRTVVTKPTVNDTAADVRLGAADAGIIWDAMLPLYPQLERVPAPELETRPAEVSVCVLKTAKQPTEALRFARYLAARDRGLTYFKEAGYEIADGDVWATTPELNLMAGAMLKPAIDETIRTFEDREACRVNRVYNGCGILVSTMRAGERPDAYFSCDSSFMKQVNDLFLDATDISTNQLVILVPKANPHDIHGLADLGKPGLKLGVGHEQKCAMGALTVLALREGRASKTVTENIVKRAPTGADLVHDLRIGALDAVIAYRSNAAEVEDELAWFPVDTPCALAVQPFAVGKESAHKQIAGRLLEALKSPESRQRFKANRFEWKGD
jgi:molybdenum ABC transporter molybdate-binding protein